MTITCYPCCLCGIPVTDEIIYNEIFYETVTKNLGSYSENTRKITHEIKENVKDGRWLNEGVLVYCDGCSNRSDGYNYYKVCCDNGVRYQILDTESEISFTYEIFDKNYFLFHKRCFGAVEKYMERKGTHLSLQTSFFDKRKHGVEWDIQRGLYSEAKSHDSIFRLCDPKFSLENRKFISDILTNIQN